MGNICCNQDCVTNSVDGYPVIHSPKKVEPNYDTDVVKGAGGGYMFYNAMDDNNKKAMDVATTDGWDAAVKHMMTGSDGKPRSYGEMRALYG
jgi:hypothetical protein